MADGADAGLGVGAPPDRPDGPDPLWDDWETPLHSRHLPDALSAPGQPALHVEGFDGPLDLLLDLVEHARIDLSRLPIGTIIAQLVDALERLQTQPIECRADWLILAAKLLLLRSRLLLAADPRHAAEAQAEARHALRRLRDLQRVRAAAAWLESRPQLGRDVFARPRLAPDPRVASYMQLMEACLGHLEREEQAWEACLAVQTSEAVYQPAIPPLFRIADAIARMRKRLRAFGEPRPLRDFLPELPPEAPNRALLARSAVSSTFVAALEASRLGEAELEASDPPAFVIVRPS